MRSIHFPFLLVAAALLVTTAGCTNESERPGRRLLRATDDALADCENIEEICTASFPAMCFEVCADGDDRCTEPEVCPAIYPSTCTAVCDRDDGDSCAVYHDVTTPDGEDVVVCFDDGGMPCSSDDPSCGGTTPPGDACTAASECELGLVPAICQVCPDGSCADPVAACNDGRCGFDWVCSGDPAPECTAADECELGALPAICQICSDGSCASPRPTCEAGQCGFDWVCGDDTAPECTAADECELDALPAICHVCADGTCADARPTCNEGECGFEWVCTGTGS